MNRAAASAARSLARSPGRSLALLALMCAAFLALTMIRAGYADMFDRVKASVTREYGDISFALEGGEGLGISDYLSLKARILSDGRFRATRASVSIDGLAGLGDRSAPASGVAVEEAIGEALAAAGSPAPAQLGAALAETLGAQKGDRLSALIGDVGFDLELSRIVETEAAMLDRFYLRIPLEALPAEDAAWRIDRIGIWLADAKASRLDAIRELSAMPGLSGYEPSSYELGNTIANSVVDVYEGSFRVVLAAVALAMLLALGNAALLSSWERGSEWGTMLALGSPFKAVASALTLEAVVLSAAACLIGSALTLALSAAANLAGGIVLPPPPTQAAPVVVRFRPEASALALATALSLACAIVSSLAAALSVRRRSIVELLFERN
jgi:ABC-type lipoprotein release transport system permease subunit